MAAIVGMPRCRACVVLGAGDHCKIAYKFDATNELQLGTPFNTYVPTRKMPT